MIGIAKALLMLLLPLAIKANQTLCEIRKTTSTYTYLVDRSGPCDRDCVGQGNVSVYGTITVNTLGQLDRNSIVSYNLLFSSPNYNSTPVTYPCGNGELDFSADCSRGAEWDVTAGEDELIIALDVPSVDDFLLPLMFGISDSPYEVRLLYYQETVGSDEFFESISHFPRDTTSQPRDKREKDDFLMVTFPRTTDAPCVSACCGGAPYDSTFEVCCGDVVGSGNACCNGIPYDDQMQACCQATTLYDPALQVCCSDGPADACCAGKSYDPESQVCCDSFYTYKIDISGSCSSTDCAGQGNVSVFGTMAVDTLGPLAKENVVFYDLSFSSPNYNSTPVTYPCGDGELDFPVSNNGSEWQVTAGENELIITTCAVGSCTSPSIIFGISSLPYFVRFVVEQSGDLTSVIEHSPRQNESQPEDEFKMNLVNNMVIFKRIMGASTSCPTECCGGESYDPSIQACCQDTTLYDPASLMCCTDGLAKACCADKSYDQDNQVCCLDGPADACCAGKTYDPSTQACCANDAVYDPSSQVCCDSVVANGTDCCNGTAYDSATQACCANDAVYDTASQVCCGNVIGNGTECFSATMCGNTTYDSATQSCCNGIAVYDPTVLVCCENGPAEACCGVMGFNATTERCCKNNNQVVPKRGGKCKKPGRRTRKIP